MRNFSMACFMLLISVGCSPSEQNDRVPSEQNDRVNYVTPDEVRDFCSYMTSFSIEDRERRWFDYMNNRGWYNEPRKQGTSELREALTIAGHFAPRESFEAECNEEARTLLMEFWNE